MAFEIHIATVQAYQPPNDPHSYSQMERNLTRNILREMQSRIAAKKDLRDCYSSYMPYINWDLPESRGRAGHALKIIWVYCHEQYLPWLNMLVELKMQPYPGQAIMDHYVSTYNNMAGFKLWADSHAKLAETLLLCGDIVIV